MELTVNGDTVVIDEPVDVERLLAHLDLPGSGVAVAINGVVCPKEQWDQAIPAYAEIDVLTAVQGG